MTTQGSCKEKYRELRNVVRDDDVLEFTDFFLEMVEEYAKDSSKSQTKAYRDLLNKDKGSLTDTNKKDIKRLTRSLGKEVLQQIRYDCGKRHKLTKEFERAQSIMKRLAVQTNVSTLVTNEFSKSTQLTPTTLKSMIDSSSSSRSKSSSGKDDLPTLIERSISLMADLLSRDVTAVRPLIEKLLIESTKSNTKWTKQQLSKLQFPEANAPSKANLRKLLRFIKTYFPQALVDYENVDSVLEKATDDPEYMAATYTRLRDLLLSLVLTRNTDMGFGSFVETVKMAWNNIRGGYRKEIPSWNKDVVPTDESTMQYLDELLDALIKTKEAMLDYMKKCTNRRGTFANWATLGLGGVKSLDDERDKSDVNVNCRHIMKEARILQTVIEQVQKYIFDNDYTTLKREITTLAGSQLVKTIKDTIDNDPNYTELKKYIVDTKMWDDLDKRIENK
jgi:hypothetical protein